MFTIYSMIGSLVWLAGTNAHLTAFTKGMYCLNGNQSGVIDQNAETMVNPLFDLPQSLWWMHHVDSCDEFPPPEDDFIELIPGKDFTVQIATNQAFTNFSYGGKYVSDWADGQAHDFTGNTECIVSPNMHTQNESMAAGTAFAISYESDVKKVTMENLVVFSVLHNTPWHLVATYPVPSKMPACPAEGCTCVWSWVPNKCGTPNIYMMPSRCRVMNPTSNVQLATPKPAVWCEGDPNSCTKGAKQVIGWNQATGNNIEVEGFDLSGNNKSPGYNLKLGFQHGAQEDIFVPSDKRNLHSSGGRLHRRIGH